MNKDRGNTSAPEQATDSLTRLDNAVHNRSLLEEGWLSDQNRHAPNEISKAINYDQSSEHQSAILTARDCREVSNESGNSGSKVERKKAA
jgi:hypothetical protein